MYDAIEQAYTSILVAPHPDKISALVVLTDGGDSHSRRNFNELLDKIQFNREENPIRIFTVGYGSDIEKHQLSEIAKVSGGKFYDGTILGTDAIVKNMAAFF